MRLFNQLSACRQMLAYCCVFYVRPTRVSSSPHTRMLSGCCGHSDHITYLSSLQSVLLFNPSCDLQCPLLVRNAVCHVGITPGGVCETRSLFCSGSCFQLLRYLLWKWIKAPALKSATRNCRSLDLLSLLLNKIRRIWVLQPRPTCVHWLQATSNCEEKMSTWKKYVLYRTDGKHTTVHGSVWQKFLHTDLINMQKKKVGCFSIDAS